MGEAQGIPKQLAVLARAVGRQIGRANANALAAEGNAGEDYGEGGVVARGQRISRRTPSPAAVAAGNTRPGLAGGRAIEHHDQFQRAGPDRPASELGLGLNTMAREGWITRTNRQRDQRAR
jgi:hypothetical protein